MRGYELYVIFSAEAEEDEVSTALERLTQILAADGGEVSKVEPRGKRRLAYAIKKQAEGQDVILYFQAAAQTIQELDRTLKLNEKVLRHLIVRLTEEE